MLKKRWIVDVITIAMLIGISLTGYVIGCQKPVKPIDYHLNGSDISQGILQQAMKQLKNKGFENSDGMLILKRYSYYMKELLKGNGFSSYKMFDVPTVYNFVAFSDTINKYTIDTLVNNTLRGRDAFEGISGFFERAYISASDGSIDSYLIYVPTTYDKSSEFPLVVLLHGIGEMAYISPHAPSHSAFIEACEKNGVIMVAPCGKHGPVGKETFYKGEGEQDVLQVIDLVKKAYNIDESRVYLTGLSMGGFGTWHIGSRNSHIFAAIAPVCGFGTGNPQMAQIFEYYYLASGAFITPPVIAPDNFKVDISKLSNVPIMVYHGDNDPTVPVEESRELVKRAQENGFNITYIELEGVAHNAWDYAYIDDTLIKWFLQYSK